MRGRAEVQQLDPASADVQFQAAVGVSSFVPTIALSIFPSPGQVQAAPAAGGGMAMKICMTKEMAERSEVPASQGDCKTTRQQRTGNTMTVAFTCTRPPSTGEAQMTFHNSESYSSRAKVTSSPNGKPETMTMEGTGKWLAADCGAVKPVQAR